MESQSQKSENLSIVVSNKKLDIDEVDVTEESNTDFSYLFRKWIFNNETFFNHKKT